jgi:pimeloyl-ACP methyl ester carboxylesterase
MKYLNVLIQGEHSLPMNQLNPSKSKVKHKVKEIPVTFGSNGLKLTGKAFLPDNATTDAPVPGAILCHGFGSSHRVMKDSARMIAQKGVASFIFDFRGHGTSEGAVDGRQADDAIDAWNFMSKIAEIDETRMGLVGHSLGAMSAIIAAGQICSPKVLVSLACPHIPKEEIMASMPANYGKWGSKHSRVVEFPRHGSPPWITGLSGIIARLWMYATHNHVRIDVNRFFEGIKKVDMESVLSKLVNCRKLFVFCEGDTITPYAKSVHVYNAACEPKIKLLSKGQHSTPISRGSLHLQWTDWVVENLLA